MTHAIHFFYDNYRNSRRLLANFYCQCADRHMNSNFMRRVREREPAIRQFVIVKNLPSGSADYFDNEEIHDQ